MNDKERQVSTNFHHCALLYAAPQRELEKMKHYTARFSPTVRAANGCLTLSCLSG